MIRSFAHKGLERFYKTGSRAGINPRFVSRLALQLSLLDVARGPREMDLPGWQLHELKGELAGRWAVSVNGNWRLTFRFQDDNVEFVDLLDYH